MKGPVRALFLITWSEDQDWPFIDRLREQGVFCDVLGSDFPKGYNTALQKIATYWPRYLSVGVRAFFRRKDYDIIMGWQQVSGMVYGFFKRISGSRYPRLVVMKFTYPAKKNPLLSAFRYGFVRFVLGSADALWCHSSREVENRSRQFHLPVKKVKYVPMVLTDISDYATSSRIKPGKGDYILSVGGNDRDYALLAAAAVRVPYPIHVVTQPVNVKDIGFPGHVRVHHVYGEEVMRLFMNARFVAVPIKDPGRPAGESVLLEAFSFGKPVVITRTVSSVDYVRDRVNGFLVEPGDTDRFASCMRYLLDHPREAEAMGRRNREMYLSTYSAPVVAGRIKEEMERVLEGSPG
jgi:glycosyltransferase involved in cell wall biosynthesis